MSIQFKLGERAKFYSDIAGLSEIMAAFLRQQKPEEYSHSISKANNIQEFLNLSRCESVSIERNRVNDWSATVAARMLEKHKFPIQVSSQELEQLWIQTTANWWSRDYWINLQMAIYTKLQGTVGKKN